MKYGLIGEKLSHSFSKEVHGKIATYDYELKEIAKEDLKGFILSKDFLGLNVTIPYKSQVIPFLDEISSSAKKIGAVNTIVNKNGKLIGYNTDYDGAKLLIQKNGVSLKNKSVYILGSGGASKTLSVVAKDLGAKEVFTVSRKGENGIDYAKLIEQAQNVQVLINATPVGTYPNITDYPINAKTFTNLKAVIDLIYNPLNTELVLSAKEMGVKASGGLYMLVAQAIYAYSYFFDTTFEQKSIDKIYGELLKEKQNVVLTGMPSCGKSTIGKALAKKLASEFIDTDEEITKKYGKTPKDIILSYGEEKFRELESEIISELSKKTGLIIATGGGAVLRDENVKNLKRNGKIFYLEKDVNSLITSDDRPLTSSKEDLLKIYEKRKDIYILSADEIIDANGEIEQIIGKIIKEQV